MKAFYNDPLVKEKHILNLINHYNTDEIIKDRYWEFGKGCAVCCTLHLNKDKDFESELGIPNILARFEDAIFQGLTKKLAKEFPMKFLTAIKVGADLSSVWKLFMVWVLTDSEYGIINSAECKTSIQDVADTYMRDTISPITNKKEKEIIDDAAAAYTSYAVAYIYAAVYSYAYRCTVYKIARKQWYIEASNKLIELLKEAN